MMEFLMLVSAFVVSWMVILILTFIMMSIPAFRKWYLKWTMKQVEKWSGDLVEE